MCLFLIVAAFRMGTRTPRRVPAMRLAGAGDERRNAAHPTFQRYFLLIVPFLAIPAAAGLYAASARLYDPERPLWPVMALGLLTLMDLAKSIAEDRDSFSWRDIEQIAAKTDRVMPVEPRFGPMSRFTF